MGDNEGNSMMTRKELADFLGVSIRTIFRWDRKGWTKPMVLGKVIRYRRSDVNELIKSVTVGSYHGHENKNFDHS